MSRSSSRVAAGLTASALAVLMSQTALAGVDVHVSVPTIHISVPTVHVSAPTVQVQAPIITKTAKTKNTIVNSYALHRDHQDSGGDRWDHKTPVVIATNRSTPVNLQGSLAVNHRGDLPKGGRSNASQTTSEGVTVVTTNVPGTIGLSWPRGGGTTVTGSNVPPAGVFNPNCDGAADCGFVTVPEKVVTFVPPPPPPTAPAADAFLGTTTCQGGNPNSITGNYWGFTITNSSGQVGVNIGWGPFPATATENPDGSYTLSFKDTGGEIWTITLVWTTNTNGVGGYWSVTYVTTDGQDVGSDGGGVPLTCTSSA
jgi:hypothetical protein